MVLKLSRAALLAATIGLAAPVAFVLPVSAQEKAKEVQQNEAIAFEIKVPSVIAVDSSMSEDQIKDVFTANFLTHADQLASLSASSITIPEMSFVLNVSGAGGGTSTVTYRDIVLTNVKDGHAEKLTVGSGEANSQGETTVYKAIAADGFDLKRLLEFAGIVKGDPTAPFKAIYGTATSGGSSQSGPMYSCEFGPTNSSGFEARPTKFNLNEFLQTVAKYPSGNEPPPEVLSSLISQVIDLVRGFRGGASAVGAIDCNVPGELPITVKIAGASTTDFEPAVYPEIRVSGLAVDAGPLGNGSLGEFLLKTIDFNPTLNALESAAGKLSDEWFEENWRALLPSFAGMSLADFAVDAINPDSETGERVQAKLGSFDLSLGDYLNGIPTNVSATLAGLEVPLPQDSTDPQVTTLLAAGLKGVNLGADVAANWNKDSKTIAIEKIAMSAVDLGSMSISAEIGNATEQLFAVDADTAMAASFGVTVKRVVIDVTDDGLGQIVWPLAAAQEGVTDIEAYRTQMAGFAEGVALQLLGSTDAARQLGVALGDFVTGRKGAITITITSKDPNGIPLPLFMAAQEDPTVLTGQIDVTGTAQ